MPLGMERLGPLPAPGDLDVTPGPRAGSPAGIAPPGGDALLAPVWPWKGPSCSPRLPAAAHELCPTCPAGVSGAEPARPSAPRTYGKEEYKQRTRAKWRTKAAGSLFAPPSAPRPLASHPGGLAPRLRGPAPPPRRCVRPCPPPRFSLRLPRLPCPAQPQPPPRVRASQLSPGPASDRPSATGRSAPRGHPKDSSHFGFRSPWQGVEARWRTREGPQPRPRPRPEAALPPLRLTHSGC